MNSPGESIEMGTSEAVDSTVGEKSPWGKWGAILPVPEGNVERFNIARTVYRNSKQEIIIQYSFGPRDAKTTRFFNFSQGKLELECKDQTCSQEMVSSLDRIKLEELKVSSARYTRPEGGFRKRISGGGACVTPMDLGYEISLPNGEKDYRKMIWVSSDKYDFHSTAPCNEKFDQSITHKQQSLKEFTNNVGNIIRQSYDNYEYIQAKAINFEFYSLSDETILGISKDTFFNPAVPVVIIFKNDLTSPFLENQTQVIRFDGNLADSIYRVCSADARVKKNPSLTTLEAADACFVETIKNGVSDDLKKTLDKKIEQFYLKKEPDGTKNNLGEKWGVFLPFPKGASGDSVAMRGGVVEGTINIWDTYRNSNNEVVIVYSFYLDDNQFWRVFNFSQDKLEYECREDKEQKDQCSLNKITAGLRRMQNTGILSAAQINEGFTLNPGITISKSYALRSGGYEIISPNGDIRYETIIWLSPEKHGLWVSRYSDGFDAKEISNIRAETPFMIYYEIDEKTILGRAANNAPIVVIFRNDMTSQYFNNNPSLIQMDGKRADAVYDDCLSETSMNAEYLENADKCFVEFLKGEYPWL